MTDFCIQIHPHRYPQSDVAEVISLCERLSTDSNWVRRFSPVHGTDGHAYVNLMFETDDPKLLWQLLHEQLYNVGATVPFMHATSMAMCEGQRGWDDYLLLYHFDPAVTCDRFPG